MTIFDHRRREEEGPAGAIYPGPSVISGGAPTTPSAPIGASYVTVDVESGLSSERVISAGEKISFIDQGPGGTLTIAADAIAGPDTLDFPGQNGSVAPFVIAASAPAGVYTMVATFTINTAAATGTLDADAHYINSGAKVANAVTAFDATVLDSTAGMVSFQHTGGDISASTTATGFSGTPLYEVHFRLVRLG